MHTHDGFIRILQLTDSHITGEKQAKFFGVATFDLLQAVLTAMMADAEKITPELILFTGDLSHDRSAISYQHISDILRNLPYRIIWTAGNHDGPKRAIEVLNTYPNIDNTRSYLSDHWHIIVLNSYLKHHVDGKLDTETLIFLDRALSEHLTKHTLIFLHHHVLPVGSDWLDPLNVRNSEAFLKIIDKYTHIRAVICGHVHQEFYTKRNGIPFMSTPATSVQFLQSSHDFALDTTLMPGYRWFNLYPDGRHETGVCRLPHHPDFVPDPSSKGYCIECECNPELCELPKEKG